MKRSGEHEINIGRKAVCGIEPDGVPRFCMKATSVYHSSQEELPHERACCDIRECVFKVLGDDKRNYCIFLESAGIEEEAEKKTA